ncbi:MAG: phage baseplate assembly protein V [Sandaracinaceae bacterium]|nr:phage baseplate assembly protein V [Sandaracinaceae bacterium]
MNEDNHIVNGVLVGTVCSEPDELGRVEVQYEWMEGESFSFRAPIATLMSGSRRGSWFMPEEGDEVLVAFDQGRFDHPFIVGFLWNGASAPPNDDQTQSGNPIDRNLRRVRTVSGHVLEFDDNESDTRVHLRSAGGHDLVLDDASSAATVRLTTSGGGSGGHTLELSDREQNVRLQTKAGHVLELSDQGQKAELSVVGGSHVTLDAAAGTIHIESAGKVSIEVTSTGQVNIKAPLGVDVTTLRAVFSGILEAQLVKATVGKFETVSSGAYTPTYGVILP